MSDQEPLHCPHCRGTGQVVVDEPVREPTVTGGDIDAILRIAPCRYCEGSGGWSAPAPRPLWRPVSVRFPMGDVSVPVDTEHAARRCWTLSRSDAPGWETDSGCDGYGLTYEVAAAICEALNRSGAVIPEAKLPPWLEEPEEEWETT